MDTERTVWIAHTAPKGAPADLTHPIRQHAEGVTDLAVRFACEIDESLVATARICGLFHDLGKYGDRFQARLAGKEQGIDHWTVGAWVALSRYRCYAGALAIQGHHIGLQDGLKAGLDRLQPECYAPELHGNRRLSEANVDLLLDRLQRDGLTVPPPSATLMKQPKGCPSMLRTRIVFSILTDADFLDTESHFVRTAPGPKRVRPAGPTLDPAAALAALDRFQTKLTTKATGAVCDLRREVSEACALAAEAPVGLFTLTAPTGSGKTLAMLRFALRHARRHNLRRIVVVLPYLTLIEQTAGIYREIFAEFGANFVLEDHSLSQPDGEEDAHAKLLAENWDAPIVITTNVQFFESLHQNRPSACRKLHRLGRSVILCDEVQALPHHVKAQGATVGLVVPTLSTLAALSAEFRATVLFATATQPAFDAFDALVRADGSPGWRPREILPNVADLFARSKRVETEWRFEPQPWEALAEEIAAQPGTLAIVNLRKDAARLAAEVQRLRPDARVLHLSTNMCVAHRRQVLQQVRDEGIEREGFLIATQCVEAGVDLDFARVFRAWAPLDAIAQAAGRCNRNGREEVGKVVVFLPEGAGYPLGGYRQATQAAGNTVRAYPDPELHDPAFFRTYFQNLYWAQGLQQEEDPLKEAIIAQNYVEVARLYRLIPESGVNVVVRVGDRLGPNADAENAALLDELDRGLTKRLMLRLRPYTVSLYRSGKNDLPLQPLRTANGEEVPGWFLLDRPDAYDPLLGLQMEEPADALIA